MSLLRKRGTLFGACGDSRSSLLKWGTKTRISNRQLVCPLVTDGQAMWS